jgi:threonine aldolase
MIFDLRSDTVTRPSEAMRQAMVTAEVGDDVYREDPTVARLEQRTAEVVGTEAALFVPSGTMANQIALLCHTRPGDEVICGEGAHCAYYESGAAPAWSGVQFEQVGSGGLFSATDVEAGIKPRAYYCPNTSLVVVENTHNRSGGRVFAPDAIANIAEVCKREKLGLHLDGARIWNAATALDKSVAELCAPFDTVSVCFSKGLGAPVGSAICGSNDHMARALRFRKMLGGGMRQAGVIAAGALYALEHNRERVKDDHAGAQQIASALRAISSVRIDAVETNIVNVHVDGDAKMVAARGVEHDVLFSAIGPHTLRIVTHLDVVRTSFDDCVGALVQAFQQALRA